MFEIYKPFEIYKAIGGKKTYLVFDADVGRTTAWRLGKDHYKTANANLKIQVGYLVGDELCLKKPRMEADARWIVYKR